MLQLFGYILLWVDRSHFPMESNVSFEDVDSICQSLCAWGCWCRLCCRSFCKLGRRYFLNHLTILGQGFCEFYDRNVLHGLWLWRRSQDQEGQHLASSAVSMCWVCIQSFSSSSLQVLTSRVSRFPAVLRGPLLKNLREKHRIIVNWGY